jgi:hypothetical protein
MMLVCVVLTLRKPRTVQPGVGGALGAAPGVADRKDRPSRGTD